VKKKEALYKAAMGRVEAARKQLLAAQRSQEALSKGRQSKIDQLYGEVLRRHGAGA
jgi:hypothetical protein